MDAGEILIRLGTLYETADALEEQAHRAYDVLGVHGVSVLTGDPARIQAPASAVARAELEQHGFPVHDTPTRRSPRHRTVELPHPVTLEVAATFNALFGRQT